MTQTELLYVLALQKTPNIGDIIAKKLIANCGSAKSVFESNTNSLLKIDGIGTKIISGLKDKNILIKKAEKELDFIQKNNINYWYFKNDDYPDRLAHCIDGPILLFNTGNIDLANSKVISIVGTRNLTNYGKHFCEKLINELSIMNPVIVSGFAYGADICAHKSAIKNNLQTIGCLAHGLNQIYPKVHKKYITDVDKNGGFISDFWSTDEPERNNFLK